MADCDIEIPADILDEINCILENLDIKLDATDYYLMANCVSQIPEAISSDICKALWLLSKLKGSTNCPSYYFGQFDTLAINNGCSFSPESLEKQKKASKIWAFGVSEEGVCCG